MYVTMRQVPSAWFLGAMTAVVRGDPGVEAASRLAPVRAARSG